MALASPALYNVDTQSAFSVKYKFIIFFYGQKLKDLDTGRHLDREHFDLQWEQCVVPVTIQREPKELSPGRR